MLIVRFPPPPQLIQDEIKALVQLQKRQSGAQSHPSAAGKTLEPPADLECEIQASSPSKITTNPQESSDEGLVTVQSSGYGTLSTWEPGTTTGSLEEKDEVSSSRKKQDGGTPRSVLAKTQGQDSVPIRPVTSNNSPHTASSTVPNLPADKQRLNRWEAFQCEAFLLYLRQVTESRTPLSTYQQSEIQQKDLKVKAFVLFTSRS